MYIYIYYIDQLSIATSKNFSVLNTIYICSFLLNSCDCLRPEYNSFFKVRQVETMLRQIRP